MSDELHSLCGAIRGRIAKRRVIPFLGAGASLAGRPRGADWRAEGYLPSGGELAEQFGAEYAYPSDDRNQTLVRIAQFVDVRIGEAVLYEDLRRTFAGTYGPTVVHEFLADASAGRPDGAPNPWPMIITTNYDDALEQAYDQVCEPYDVITYFAEPGRPAYFRHRAPDGRVQVLADPLADAGLAPEERTVILKLHGGIDRRDPSGDSFVITEDHYISYTADEVFEALPATLLAKLHECHLLFLGYGLEDWNLRVFLTQVWSRSVPRITSWAIQRTVGDHDRRYWQRRDIELVEADLRDWVEAMSGGGT